jgi:hypothetical protein
MTGARPIATAGLLAATLSVATACGGGGQSYDERATSACATARAHAGAAPDSVARATRTALATVRDDAPEDARPFVQGLTQESRALDTLAARARRDPSPPALRPAVDAVDVQDSLLSKTAADAGAPRCATLADGLVQRLRGDDYVPRMRRALAILERRMADEPPLRTTDLQRLHTEVEAAQEIFDAAGSRLEAMDPPDRLNALHQRFQDAVGDVGYALYDADDGFVVGNRKDIARAVAKHRRAIVRVKALARDVRAALGPEDDDETAATARAAARDQRSTYRSAIIDASYQAQGARWDAQGIYDRDDDPKVMGRLAAALDRQIRRLAAIHPPAGAARAQALFARGLHVYRDAARLAARLLRHPDAAGARRLRALDARTDRIFDAARLAYDEIGIEIQVPEG